MSSNIDKIAAEYKRANPERRKEIWGKIYETFAERVKGYLSGKLTGVTAGNEIAEEITQETFLRIQNFLPNYNPKIGPFDNALFTIAANIYRDYLRSADHRHSKFWISESQNYRAEHMFAGLRDEGDVSPDSSLIREEMDSILHGAVAEISSMPSRTAVIDRALRGMDFADVARSGRVTEIAARKRYSRGLGELRKALGEHPDFDNYR